MFVSQRLHTINFGLKVCVFVLEDDPDDEGP